VVASPTASEKEFLVDTILARLPLILQDLFTTFSNEEAEASGFVKRLRKISGARFVQVLVLGWLVSPRATLEDLAVRLNVTSQALQARFTRTAVALLQAVLWRAIEQMLSAKRANIPLLRRFNGVWLEDSTSLKLPASMAAEFPGCGGSDPEAGKAALKIYTRYRVDTATLVEMRFSEGKRQDLAAAKPWATLPAGALRLADMGFFDRQRLEADHAAGVYWISRLPAGVTLQAEGDESRELHDFLGRQQDDLIDIQVLVGKPDRHAKPLSCRLVAIRCPPAIAAERRRKLHAKMKKKGGSASARQLALCDWTVMITNVPADKLSPAEVWELYRVRWQIELLFKRWKSLGGLQPSTNLKKSERVLCEIYAKLIGMLVAHWGAFLRGGPLDGFSLVGAIKRVMQIANRIGDQLSAGLPLDELIAELKRKLDRMPKQPRRKKRRSTRQRLMQPRLAA
jgi:Transposase DDE domain